MNSQRALCSKKGWCEMFKLKLSGIQSYLINSYKCFHNLKCYLWNTLALGHSERKKINRSLNCKIGGPHLNQTQFNLVLYKRLQNFEW